MAKKLNEMTREEALLVLEKSGLLPPATEEETPGIEKEKSNKSRRSNGEGSWTSSERKNGTYWKYTIYLGKGSDGKVKTKSFGSYKKSEAVRKANSYRTDYLKGKIDSKATFQEYFKDWMLNYKFKEVTNSTFEAYLSTYKLRVLNTSLGSCKLEEITLGTLQAYFNELTNNFGLPTVKQTKIKVNGCLEKALMEGLILRNYCKGVVLKKEKRDKSKKKMKVLTREEQDLFESSLCLDYPPHQIFYLILYTGLRRGEALGLKWSDIKDNKLTIERQVVPCSVRDSDGKYLKHANLVKIPKSAHGERVVPLPKKALKLLERIPQKSEFIFVNKKGGFFSTVSLNNIFLRLTKPLGLNNKTIHSLRHTYATRLFELGESPKTVQELLGHASINITLDVYTHVMEGTKESAASKLDLL